VTVTPAHPAINRDNLPTPRAAICTYTPMT
jgi:hypothetical protein